MTETDCCVSSLGAGLLIILVIGQVVYQRILTTKPLEDKEFQGCTHFYFTVLNLKRISPF